MTTVRHRLRRLSDLETIRGCPGVAVVVGTRWLGPFGTSGEHPAHSLLQFFQVSVLGARQGEQSGAGRDGGHPHFLT